MMPKPTVSSATLWCSPSAAARAISVATVIRSPFRARARSRALNQSMRSGPDLPGAPREPLRAGQLGQPHGAAGVQLLGRDADLGAEAELPAVGEAGRGVDQDAGRVDLREESFRIGVVLRHDRLGVVRGGGADVAQSLIEV